MWDSGHESCQRGRVEAGCGRRLCHCGHEQHNTDPHDLFHLRDEGQALQRLTRRGG